VKGQHFGPQLGLAVLKKCEDPRWEKSPLNVPLEIGSWLPATPCVKDFLDVCLER
jgi:hypothetical protein